MALFPPLKEAQKIRTPRSWVPEHSMLTARPPIHDINTQHNYNLHPPSTNLTLVQKGVFYSGTKSLQSPAEKILKFHLMILSVLNLY
jgi:hypothetical protein